MGNQNRLDPKNCNKTFCKSCIFHPDSSKRVILSPEREAEIIAYLTTFKNSHICHQTDLTCYGALQVQAKRAFSIGMIPKPTVESFLEVAQIFLKK